MMWLLMLAGCVNTIRFPPDLWPTETTWTWTGDTGVAPNNPQGAPTGRVQIARVVGGCDSADATFSFTAITTGWAGVAELTLVGAESAGREDHVMTLVDLDPAGAWDRWAIDLADGQSFDAGVSTTHDCASEDQLSFAIRLTNINDRFSDCVTWGVEGTELGTQLVNEEADLQDVGCRPITP